ncbi:TIGR00341 family protein [Halodesulfurarchaeum formicicum]|uniref:TIGR00341 family protein n=1 Tax=Halodesulfurarchaeum formicicum TaxID=1873524 RepID=UPI0009045AE6|nr:TIGR00341 family protein [Halodesulfurarchaeum formicicum]
MRLVQIAVPTGKRGTVLETLDSLDIEYVVSEETGSRNIAAVVEFPLPASAVEDVLDELREVGVDEEAITVVIEAQTVISRKFDALKDRYEEANKEDPAKIAREELVATVDGLAPDISTYVVMSIISAIVATAGILLDSPAVVVGSMVIAPLIGPAMATSVGSVVADREIFVRGVTRQAIGFGVAIPAAALFALFAKSVNLVPPGIDLLAIEQVSGRLSPDFLSLAVALGAGVAGALSLSTGVSTALVGVMIAAALIPPTAVIGIGIAWAMPQAVLGASVLVLVNVLSINLAALLVLWYEGYQPEDWFQLSEARTATLKRIAVLAVAIAALSVFLGATTLATYQNATFEDQVQTEVEGTLAGIEDAELLEVEFKHRQTLLYRDVDSVVVSVGVRAGDSPPEGLAAELSTRIETETGQSVPIEVRYLAIERAG